MKKDNKTKQIVKKHYGKIAGGGSCCSCGCSNQTDNEKIAKSIGYSDEEIKSAGIANLGLGCGNPTGMGEIKEGETVLDLGSGVQRRALQTLPLQTFNYREMAADPVS